ncbi:MAG: DUF115 domain-containing protein [Chromatiales bacterium]|jgi:hypothetical protein
MVKQDLPDQPYNGEQQPGLQYMVNQFGDHYLYEVNRNTFDQTDANSVLQRQFGKQLWQEDSLFIIIGSDSGLLIRYLLTEELPPGSRYVFIEPPHLIPVIRDHLADLDFNEQISIRSTGDWLELREPWFFEDYAFINRFSMLQSIGASDAYVSDYRSLAVEIKAQMDDLLWTIRAQMGNQAFTIEQIRNLMLNRTPAIRLQNKFAGKSCIILGGGPSLDDSIDWLLENHDRVVIIAVSRICRRLLETGIKPHIIISIDPHDLSFDVSKEMLLFDKPTLFVNMYHVNHKLLAQWPGKSLYIGDLFPWQSKASPLNIPPVGGPTVTNIAITLALNMQFSQILLSGVDLCHSKDGNSHARGSNEHNNGPQLGLVGLQVETNAGWLAETTPDFYNGIKSLQSQAASTLNSPSRLINIAPGAAKIEHIDFIELDKVQLPTANDNITDTLYKAFADETADSGEQHFRLVKKELAKAHGKLIDIKKLAKEALECNDGLFGRNGKTADFKYKIRMDKIEKKLDREYKDISPLVRNFGAAEFLKMPPRDREWSDAEIERAGDTYYNAYYHSADRLLELIKQAQDKLDIFQQENSAQPDIEQLLDYWREQQIPHRATLWKKAFERHGQNIPQQFVEEFEKLEHEFREQIAFTETAHAQRCKRNTALGPIRSKLAVLFKQHNTEAIENISTALQDDERVEAQDLYQLASGYVSELQNQPDAALAAYSDIVNRSVAQLSDQQTDLKNNPRLEDALRRMSYIYLSADLFDSALMVMDTLAAISSAHEPMYADLLRLTGDFQKALDIYTDYLKRSPYDLLVMIKLGKLYRQLGVDESARWVFNHIIEQDPANKIARQQLAELGG